MPRPDTVTHVQTNARISGRCPPEGINASSAVRLSSIRRAVETGNYEWTTVKMGKDGGFPRRRRRGPIEASYDRILSPITPM